MKKILGLTMASILLFSCNQAQKPAKIETEDDKTYYSVGYLYGKRFADFKLNDREKAALMQGVREGVSGQKEQVKTMEFAMKFKDIVQKKMASKSTGEIEKGKKFLENFVKTEKAQKTDSGLAYKILTPGKDPKPKATDTVKVHYKGTLIDGTEFDSSYKRNKPIEFPLNRVIKGWTEGMQLIGKGGKIKLVIPSDLAYGNQGAPPSIPGGATLVFEVELLDIVTGKNDGEHKGHNH